MQKLEERNTYTPTDIPHVRGNCGLSLNVEETLSVPGLRTSSNNSDAALIAKEHAKQNLRVSVVYVLNMRGKPLMPTTPRKAKKLLKEGKANVVRRTPFTIQLKYATGENRQPITLGIDSGYAYIGLSAKTNKKEAYSAEVRLRTDIVKLNSERRQYRRARRNRKTWYRQPRFLNRKKSECWLAPSIQHKLDSHIKLIENVKKLLPITRIDIEVSAFDIQKIRNPEISGIEYQNGIQKDSWNVREYVLHRDNHTCHACKGKSKDPILETHHIISRQTGGDAPYNLLTLCSTCDKVLWDRTECFIFGRRKTGYFDLRKLDGTKVHASAKAKDLILLEPATTFLIEQVRRSTHLFTLKGVVSATPAPHGGL